jgi:hypothetical protein
MKKTTPTTPKISTPYVIERFEKYQKTDQTNSLPYPIPKKMNVYYFRVKRVRGGKIIFLSHPYNTKQIRSREIITMMNSLFRDGSVTITDEK